MTTTIDTTHWMDLVDDSMKLSELSIPGTHDSGAMNPDTSIELTRIRLTTQDLTISDQLLSGVRFLDIRVRYIENEFQLYHEDVSLQVSFTQVLNDCRLFLAVWPRQTIIMSVKEESSASDNDPNVTFQARFKQYCDVNSGLWYLENRIPAMGEVRGKIVLFRRFPLDTTTADKTKTIADAAKGGINAYPFQNDATFTIEGPPRLTIQDEFEVLVSDELDEKYDRVKDLLDQASAPTSSMDTLYVNFGSSAGGSLHTRPRDTANEINPKLVSYFSEAAHRKGRFGIVVTDFATTGLSLLVARTALVHTDGYWIVNEQAGVTPIGTANLLVASGDRATRAIAIGARHNGSGYYLLAADGTVYAYGTATLAGNGLPERRDAVSIAVKPDTADSPGLGYWILYKNGEVSSHNAPFHGQIERGTALEAVSIVATPTGDGYWILASNGRVHNYGEARRLEDRRDDGKIAVSMAATTDGLGYWILTSNGAVRHFGTAAHLGDGVSDGATARAIAAKPDGTGYWILSTDGNIHAYGGAHFVGRATSTGKFVGLAPAPT